MDDGFIWSSGDGFCPQGVWSANEYLEAVVSLAQVEDETDSRQPPFSRALARPLATTLPGQPPHFPFSTK